MSAPVHNPRSSEVSLALARDRFFARRRSDETRWRRLIAPAAATAALLVVVVLAVRNFPLLLGVGPDSIVPNAVLVTYAVVAVLGALWALWLRTARPPVYAAIGLGARGTSGTGPSRYGLVDPAAPLDGARR
jgi:protein-S-isoprenylcysteine O-methyltransferase Ste14